MNQLTDFTPRFPFIPRIKVIRTPWRYKSTQKLALKTDSLASYFRNKIDPSLPNSGDFVATVYGPKNVGKSESMIELCRQICPDFKLEEDVVFTLEDFYDVMENGKPKKFRVKILDDFGSEMDPREGMFDPAKHTSYYFQTSRTFFTGYFITTPNKKFINKDIRDRIADYFIEIKSRNSGAKYCKSVVQWIQHNNRLDKNYNHSLRLGPDGLINNQGYGTKIWNWILYPPPQEISDKYKPLRTAKGQSNLDKGHEDFKKAKDNKRSVDEISEEVFKKIDAYSRKTAKDKILLDRGLISHDYNLNALELSKVLSLTKKRLGTI